MNHSNYARWVSVHLRDMLALSQLHPQILTEFKSGKFVVNKSQRSFSAIALDQVHEQLNAVVKSNGGAIGLTENAAALLRWMVSGPEVADLIDQFEARLCSEKKIETHHHEQSQQFQLNFAKQVNDVVSVFTDRGNPFDYNGFDLYSVDTMAVVDPLISASLNNVEKVGIDQYNAFVNDRLIARTKPLDDPIKKNQLAPFHQPSRKVQQSSKMSVVKSDCSFFSRLYIGCQTRGGDLDDFFQYENQPFPPSLSDNGQLRFGQKSDLLQCIENDTVTSLSNPLVQCIVLDGAAIVQMLNPGKAKTFLDYASQVFMPFIESQLSKVSRLDIVWDQYWSDSLKSATRVKRGSGSRQHVLLMSTLPSRWQDFLHVNENKADLFALLSKYVMTNIFPTSKCVLATDGAQVLFSDDSHSKETLMPCTQEEADTRMLLHVLNASNCGIKRVMIRTVDTDVVVISVSKWDTLQLDELWIQFGVGTKTRYIAIHEIASSLGIDWCKALPFFHSFTGCDTTSSFVGHGKKGAWET